MAKILKPGNTWVGKVVDCPACDCQFRTEAGDIQRSWGSVITVSCPTCGEEITLQRPPIAPPRLATEGEQARLEAAWRHQTRGQRPDPNAYDPRLSGDLWSNSGPISASAPKRCSCKGN